MTRDHSKESQVSLIMDNFDWDNVYKIFKVCEYTYAKNIHEDYYPELEDIQEMAYSLLNDCYDYGKKNDMNCILSSGRFEVNWDNIDEILSLRFIPEEKEIMLDEPNEAIYVC